jgi:hypothetical protein
MQGLWLETSISELYTNSRKAFPGTSKRENSTDTVRVEHLDWVPFEGVRTLFVKATVNNEGRKNESIILFKGVNYGKAEGKGFVPLMSSSGRKVFVERLSVSDDEVLVRCTCGDFFWRFNYYNSVDKSLFGRKRSKYEGQNLWKANPTESSGMCKHLMKLAKILREADLLIAGRNI